MRLTSMILAGLMVTACKGDDTPVNTDVPTEETGSDETGLDPCGDNPPVVEFFNMRNATIAEEEPAIAMVFVASDPDGDLTPSLSVDFFWDDVVDGDLIGTPEVPNETSLGFTGIELTLAEPPPRCGLTDTVGGSVPFTYAELDDALSQAGFDPFPKNQLVEFQIIVTDNDGLIFGTPGHSTLSEVVTICTPKADGSPADLPGCVDFDTGGGDTDTDDTDVPVDTDTDTDVPVDTDTDIPVDTDTDVPVDTDTDVPVDTDTDVPVDTDTDVPVDTDDTDVPVDTDTDTDVATTTFAAVNAIFADKCAPCHTGATSGGHDMGASNLVDAFTDSQLPSNADATITKGERAIARITSGQMPQGRGCTGDPVADAANTSCLTQVELDTLIDWVADGQLQ